MPPVGRGHALDTVLGRIAFVGVAATGIRAVAAAVAVASLVVGQGRTMGRDG